jgi:hypothetical protein
MKKILVFAVILALLVPAAAFAAAEFTLGGFVKLDTFWSSTQAGKNMNTPIQPSNNPDFQHGRVKFTAQGSRFNLTIKGPDLWGAKTSGFIEMDFDSAEQGVVSNATAAGATAFTALNASNNYTPRLRHAMFRFNWPTTELLFGQYWSMFCEFYNESVQDGPLQGFGMPTARLAQVRVSQQFGDGFTIAGLIGEPTNALGTNQTLAFGGTYTGLNNGESSETPQVQAKLQYQKDLWGKAAYYGAPMPFTARVIGGWQRNVYRPNAQIVTGQNLTAVSTLSQNALSTYNVQFGNHQYLDPWMLMANMFLPVIPTNSANLAGTASLSVQGYIGQGLGTFGNNTSTGTNDTYGKFNASYGAPGVVRIQAFDEELYKQYGGYVQGQYYFTNHWFTNVTYGMQKQFGVSQTRYNQLQGPVSAAGNPQGYGWVGLANQPNFNQEVDFTLWYRPIQAFKFGLQYTWQRSQWMQVNATPATFVTQNGLATATQQNSSNSGMSSRVEFVGFFYF